jgi:hypothetical protein
MNDAPGGPGPGAPPPGSVRPVVALAFATIGFAAFTIGGLGVASLLLGEDVIAARGFGQAPGAVGTALAVSAFAATLWAALRAPRPSFWGGVWAGLAAFLVYLAVVWIVGAAQTADVVLAASVVGRLVTSGFAFVVLAAGLLAGWGGIALVRTRGRRPRWPWEDDESP